MQINDKPATSSFSNPASSGAAGNSNTTSSFQDLLTQLSDYSGSDPGKAMWDSALAQLGISPQQYAQMTPQEQAKIDEKVQQLIKQEVQQQSQQQTQAAQLAPAQQAATQLHAQSGAPSDQSSSNQRGRIYFSI
jgi:hypothetical protein